jgi:large subunit ribosomal protein L17
MKHLKTGRKFGRMRGQRHAFLNTLAANMIRREKITTTEARAKELRGVVERMVTHGKKQDLAGMRLLLKKLPKAQAYKVHHDIAPRYKSRKGGYTRITKGVKLRTGDAAPMATIEFV